MVTFYPSSSSASAYIYNTNNILVYVFVEYSDNHGASWIGQTVQSLTANSGTNIGIAYTATNIRVRLAPIAGVSVSSWTNSGA